MKTFSTVQKGSKGTDVYILQAMLRALQLLGANGKPLDIDGVAGDNVVYAINTFQTVQRAYGYECGTNGKNDGTFGNSCWNRLLGVNQNA